ncbi:MAG: hypothetical protein R2747_12530 [Pyrinomonadaceae bacterium]
MIKKSPLNFLINLLLIGVICSGAIRAGDDVTDMEVVVTPSSAKIRPLETAVIQVKLYGKKKKGLLGGLLSADEGSKQRVQSNDWKISLPESGGWLSKPFLFQEDGERTKTGFENFVKQGLGAIASKDSILYTAPEKPGKYKIKITHGNLSEEITIEVSNSALSAKKGAEGVKFPAAGKTADPYFDLIAHYAPFIAQETWFTPDADFLSRFDYDGDWKGDDNWENLEKSSSQAFVYYAAMETETHWFLLYNFYHPRDYSDICVVGTCHENDNEGLVMTVRKDGSKYGRLEVMETLAHNNIYSFTNDSAIKKGIHDIDGKIDLYENTRPIIFIEAGGHGVYGSDSRSSLFSADKMDFKDNTGVTYIYKGKPESPRHSNARLVGYDLLPIYDQWWMRGNQDSDQSNETFENFYTYEPFGGRPRTRAKFIAGAFRGRTASDNMAKPFWAWHDRRTKDKKLLNTGQWGLDPAYAVSVNLKFPENRPVSTRYVFNPYLDLEGEKIK